MNEEVLLPEGMHAFVSPAEAPWYPVGCCDGCQAHIALTPMAMEPGLRVCEICAVGVVRIRREHVSLRVRYRLLARLMGRREAGR